MSLEKIAEHTSWLSGIFIMLAIILLFLIWGEEDHLEDLKKARKAAAGWSVAAEKQGHVYCKRDTDKMYFCTIYQPRDFGPNPEIACDVSFKLPRCYER